MNYNTILPLRVERNSQGRGFRALSPTESASDATPFHRRRQPASASEAAVAGPASISGRLESRPYIPYLHPSHIFGCWPLRMIASSFAQRGPLLAQVDSSKAPSLPGLARM